MNEPPPPAILPPTQKPPVYGPIYSPEKNGLRKPSIPPIFSIMGIVIILLVGSVLFVSKHQKQTVVAPTPTPTTTPSPTPVQTLSPFATQSASVAFDQSVDALPGTLSAATISDQTLAPPSVDLNLGFQK